MFADPHLRQLHVQGVHQAPITPHFQSIRTGGDDAPSSNPSRRSTPESAVYSNEASSTTEGRDSSDEPIPVEEIPAATLRLSPQGLSEGNGQRRETSHWQQLPNQTRTEPSQQNDETPSSESFPVQTPTHDRGSIHEHSPWVRLPINYEIWQRNFQVIYGHAEADSLNRTPAKIHDSEVVTPPTPADKTPQREVDVQMHQRLSPGIGMAKSSIPNRAGLKQGGEPSANKRPLSRMPQSTVLERNFPLVRIVPETDRYLERILSQGEDHQAIFESSCKISWRKLCFIWPNIMLRLLTKKPHLALRVLIGMKLWPGQRVVSNVLKVILDSAFRPYGPYNQRMPPELFSQIMTLLWVYPHMLKDFEAKVFFILFTHSDEAQLKDFLKLFRHSTPEFSCDTLFHLATALGRVGLYDDALFVLQHASRQKGFDQRATVFEKVCTTILRKSLDKKDGYKANTSLVAEMVKLGLRLNVIHYNVLLYNAFRADDPEAAKTLFDLYHQVGVTPDDYTVATMLYGLQRAGTDHDLRQATLNHAMHILQERPSQALADHVLRAQYIYSKRDGSTPPFKQILGTYRSMFDDRVLCDLGICEKPVDSAAPIHAPRKLEPTANSIKTMMHAYMSRPSFFWNPEKLIPLYTRFRSLIEQRSDFSELLDRNVLYNLFMDRFGRRRTTVHLCLDVLVDMTRLRDHKRRSPSSWIEDYFKTDKQPSLSSEQTLQSKLVIPRGVGSRWIKQSRPYDPDVYTYNILLRSFMRHHHFEATSRVLMLMGKNEIEPDVVTWNTLATAYVLSGKLQEAADTLNAMERDGVSVTDDAMRTLASVGGQRLAQEMDRRKTEASKNANGSDAGTEWETHPSHRLDSSTE